MRTPVIKLSTSNIVIECRSCGARSAFLDTELPAKDAQRRPIFCICEQFLGYNIEVHPHGFHVDGALETTSGTMQSVQPRIIEYLGV